MVELNVRAVTAQRSAAAGVRRIRACVRLPICRGVKVARLKDYDFVRQAVQGAAFSQRDGVEYMEITSSLLPPKDGVVLMVLDALVDGRSFVVAIGEGAMRGDQVHLSPVGQRCLDRMGEHLRQQGAAGAVHMVEVQRFNRVAKRCRQAFAAAKEGDAVFFVCGDGAIYDAVFDQLKVQMRPGLMTQH